jgi:hypothetical protein
MAMFPYPTAMPDPGAPDPNETWSGRNYSFFHDRRRRSVCDYNFVFHDRRARPINDSLSNNAAAQKQSNYRKQQTKVKPDRCFHKFISGRE